MGVCLLEQSIGGGTQELGLSSSPVGGDAYSAGEYTNLNFGSFRFPGACAVNGDGSNAYITVPNLIIDLNMKNSELPGETHIAAENSTQIGFETISDVPVKTQNHLLACFVKKLSKALTGLTQDNRIEYEGGFDTDNWDYRILKSGSENLASEYFAFPAILEDDTVTFYIPCAIRALTDKEKETMVQDVGITFAKIGSTALQFYWRAWGNKTKKNVLSLPGPRTIKAETFGLTVTCVLASATGLYAAGIVSPQNKSNAITLAWLLMSKHYAVKGGNSLAPFFTPAEDTGWQWYIVTKNSVLGGHLVNVKGTDAEASSLVAQTEDSHVGVIFDANRPTHHWTYMFSAKNGGFSVEDYVGADITVQFRSSAGAQAPVTVGIFSSSTSSILSGNSYRSAEPRVAYDALVSTSRWSSYAGLPAAEEMTSRTYSLRWDSGYTGNCQIGLFVPSTGDSDENPSQVYIEDVVFLEKLE